MNPEIYLPTLKRDGLWIEPDFLTPPQLVFLQESFRMQYPYGVFDEFMCIVRLPCGPLARFVLELIQELLTTLERSVTTIAIRRLLPNARNGYGAFQWHHDCRPGQFKAMLLLTDVGAADQRMDYIPGSHTMHWPDLNYEHSRFSEDSVLRYGKPVQCLGDAGTLVLFDTNGLHRGNRTLGKARDTVTVYLERL